MACHKTFLVALVAGFSLCVPHSVFAGTQQATCEFTKEGDRVNNASGACTISEDEGKITIIRSVYFGSVVQ